MAATRTPAPRRRARRGSLERPVNGRLYRGAFFVLSLPLLILAFSVVRPTVLTAPQLPPSFDGEATKALAVDLTNLPNRAPGSSQAALAAQWFKDQIAPYGLPVSKDIWREDVAGLGHVTLRNLWAVAAGQSNDAIVVLAHRDDTGTGPGANDDASGTAALVELARAYAQTSPGEPVRSSHTIVFLSTDGGSFGGLGAVRFAERSPFHIVSLIDLDAIATAGPPRVVLTGDTPRSPAPALVQTAARRILEQTSAGPVHAGILEQLIDLGFPFTLYEQGPFVSRGIPAITLTTAGERPPEPFLDRAELLDGAKLGAVGRSVQQLIGSLDQGPDPAQGSTSYVWLGGRIIRGWAIQLTLFGLLVPFLVGVVDLYAHCRRRRIALTPAARSLRSRLFFWLFAGLAFYAFQLFGAWPTGAPRPPNPAVAASGNWPVLALTAFAIVLLLAWLVSRQRLVPRRTIGNDERLAGDTVALLALAGVSLLVLATNPYALIFFLPALHAWLWLPQVRYGQPAARVIVLAVGISGPALLLWSLGSRYGLGFDTPWYLLELASVGYIQVPAVAITLAAGACTAQLVAIAAGRYAPYPARDDRPARGPLRELVRTIVLTVRARRRVTEERRRAFGG
jgi:hypothetical protein